MKSLLALTALLLTSGAGADMDAMQERWDANITLMTGIDFPDQIKCLTEKMFSCNFDTEHCEDGVHDYPKDFPAQSWDFDFQKMRLTMDKGSDGQESEGDLRYLGGTTYLMSLDKYPHKPGWVASFSSLEKQIYLNWYLPSTLGIVIQGHTGTCEVQ